VTYRCLILACSPLYDTRTLNLLETAQALNWECHLACWAKGRHFFPDKRFPTASLHHRDESAAFQGSISRYLLFQRWFRQVGRQVKPDVVIITELPLFPLAKFFRRLGSVVVLDIQEYFSRFSGRIGIFARVAEKVFFRYADGFILVSPDMQRKRSKPYVVMPNYQRRSEFHVQPETSHVTRICYFGSLSRSDRDVDTMLGLAELLLFEFGSCEFLLGGKPEESDQAFELKCADLECRFPGRFKWFGQTKRADVVRYTAASDIGLWLVTEHANIIGASPNKIYEYLTAGIGVVATAGFENFGELATSGAAIVVPCGTSPSEILDRIRPFLVDSRKLAGMKHASSRYGQRFSWESNERLLQNFLKSLVNHD
jgi:glycosyltransferase involved in cell wall biosynthesis